MSRYAIDTSIPEGEPGHGKPVKVLSIKDGKAVVATASGWTISNVDASKLKFLVSVTPQDDRDYGPFGIS